MGWASHREWSVGRSDETEQEADTMTTNADLMTRRNAAVVRGIGHTTPLSASRARNAELWDVEGKR
jgi:4-aminobutyrate aminotransferase-like enzyme